MPVDLELADLACSASSVVAAVAVAPAASASVSAGEPTPVVADVY